LRAFAFVLILSLKKSSEKSKGLEAESDIFTGKKNGYNRIALNVIIAFARMVFFSLFIDKNNSRNLAS